MWSQSPKVDRVQASLEFCPQAEIDLIFTPGVVENEVVTADETTYETAASSCRLQCMGLVILGFNIGSLGILSASQNWPHFDLW